MESTIIVAALSLVGTLVGTLGGIVTSNKLIGYRLEQLEKTVNNTVEKNIQIVERIYRLEDGDNIIMERINALEKRLDNEIK